MKTSHKILIPVFSVLLAASIALVFFTMNGTLKRKTAPSGEVENGIYTSTSFAQLNSAAVQSKYPYMKSDIDSVFYSIDADGTVKFFEFDGKSFSDYNGIVKTIDIAPELTYEKIPISVSYIEKDGKTIGYGLFTNEKNPEVKLYPYVFAKLTDAPAVYGLKGKMLLLNINPEEAYSYDKTYSEIFNIDMSNGGLSRVFSQRDRQPDKTGRLTERWHILTDGFLNSAQKKAACISGRLYNSDTDVFDVFDLNRSMNKPEASEMYGTFLRENAADGGYIYLKKTPTGFKSVKFIAKEEEIARFDGDIDKDFVFSGDWVYAAKDRTFTNLVTGEEIKTEGIEAIDMFAVNADGSKVVAVANYENQAFFVVDKEGNVEGYSGDNFFNSNIKNICFAGNDTVLTTAVNEDGTCTNYLTKIK